MNIIKDDIIRNYDTIIFDYSLNDIMFMYRNRNDLNRIGKYFNLYNKKMPSTQHKVDFHL